MIARLIFMAVLTGFCMQSPAEPDTVYRTLDGNGNPVFSDQGNEQAEQIELQKSSVYPQYSIPASPSTTEIKRRIKPGPAYASLAIISPRHDTAVRSNTGNLHLQFQLRPRLQQNHSFQLLVDGSPVRTTKSTAGITLTNLDRGTHQFLAQVVEDGSGEVLQSSKTVSITVLRFSAILFKQRQALRDRKPK